MQASTRFYREVLGLVPDFTSETWVQFSVGDLKIGLHPPLVAGPTHAGVILGLEVTNLRALRERLRHERVRMDVAFHDVPGGTTLAFEDPSGNSLQAIQRGVSAADLQ